MTEITGLSLSSVQDILAKLPPEAMAPLSGLVWSPEPDDIQCGALQVPDVYLPAVRSFLETAGSSAPETA